MPKSEKLNPPISVDEKIISQFIERDPRTGEELDDFSLGAVQIGLRHAREVAQHIADVGAAIASDPTLTDAARAVKLKRAAESGASKGASALDSALAKLESEITALDRTTGAPDAPIDPTVAGQTRDRLASMEAKDRRKVILAAIENGDTRVTGAVFSAPAFLSGLSDTDAATLQMEYRRTAHPAEFARLNRLKAARDATLRAGEAFATFVKNLTSDPVAAMAEEAEAARLAAESKLAAS